MKVPGFNSSFPNQFFPQEFNYFLPGNAAVFLILFFQEEKQRKGINPAPNLDEGEEKSIEKCDESAELIPAWAATETLVLTKKN